MMNDASIQSYFSTPGKKVPKPNSHLQAAIGSQSSSQIEASQSSSQIEAAQHSLSSAIEQWYPSIEYKRTDIASLMPGPGRIAITGRIANFYHMQTPSKSPHAAKGCLKLMVKDDTGTIEVSLQPPTCS